MRIAIVLQLRLNVASDTVSPVTVEIGFTPELIEIVDDYFFRRGVLGRTAAPAPSA